jgi:tRNA(Met) cytidine acetyltransferase
VVRYRDARLQFVAPDALGSIEHAPDLLLVDEAAAIPVPLLERMLAVRAPIVFATTVHGYEGSGRGFATRFQAVLDAQRPGWRGLRLEQPVRWAAGDPLERLAFRALLLDGSPGDDAAARQAFRAGCRFDRIDRERLLADEALLGQLFGLLVLAHYRTSPLDLRFLLDGPNLAVWIAHHEQQVIGAALVAHEGAFDRALARAVWEGRRRPRGHLLAQSLAVHAGLAEAPTLRLQRIVRIAVHPAVQGCGLGGALVAAITAAARQEADAVGSSFGASAALVHFWAQQGFHPVRLGLTREAASGAPAVMVLRPLSAAGAVLYREVRARYRDALPHLLADPLRDLEPALSAALGDFTPADPVPPSMLDARDWRELAAYRAGRRDVELVLGPLQRLLHATALDGLAPEARALIEAKFQAHLTWPELVRAAGLRGRSEAALALREALAPVIEAAGGALVREELARLGTA